MNTNQPKHDTEAVLFEQWKRVHDDWLAAEIAADDDDVIDTPERCELKHKAGVLSDALNVTTKRLIETPVQTMKGIHAKLAASVYEDEEDDSWRRRSLPSALKDAERLAGEGSGM